MVNGVAEMVKNAEKLSREQYDLRAAKWLFEKWNLDPAKFQIEFNW
jgi:hypothetical protein